MIRRRTANFAWALSMMAVVFTLPDAVRAQDNYPSKPIQLLVTTAAGGANDLVARVLAQKMSDQMGLQVVIEDYVHTDHTKYFALLLNTFFAVVMALAASSPGPPICRTQSSSPFGS